MKPRTPRCLSCRFSQDAPGNTGTIECRRHAPQPAHFSPDQQPTWPVVQPTDWCGEFHVKALTAVTGPEAA